MKSKSTFSREWLPGNIMVVILGVLAMTCVYLDGVDYPSSVKAGEIVTFTAHTRFEAAEDRNNPSRVVIAFLAPKSWNAASNTTATYTSNIDEGVQTMSLVPAGTVPKTDRAKPGTVRSDPCMVLAQTCWTIWNGSYSGPINLHSKER